MCNICIHTYLVSFLGDFKSRSYHVCGVCICIYIYIYMYVYAYTYIYIYILAVLIKIGGCFLYPVPSRNGGDGFI